MAGTSVLERLLVRDRVLVVGGLIATVLLSWAYLLQGAGMDMAGMGRMALPMATRPPDLLWVLFVMWAVMMAAMMLPSAAPMILFYAGIARRRRERGEIAPAAALFASGYLVVWAVFSIGATALQWGAAISGLLSPEMFTTSVALTGGILLVAGLYQFTRLKQACLRRCRSPLDFVLTEWREGARGALVMGLRHGSFCVGCCWALMLLLFVGGVMNPLWIGGLALFVLVEKTAPAGGGLARLAGAGLVLWGGATLLSLA